MILDVHERLALIQMLPSQGDYKALQAIRNAKEAISFSPEEVEILNLRNEGDGKQTRVNWDAGKANQVVKDVPLDKYITSLFRDEIAKLNADGKLTEQTMSLYEKFIVMYK